MTTTDALHAPSSGAPFERTTIERREVGPLDVAIDIKFCGICHSDIHQREGPVARRPGPLFRGLVR